MMFKILQWLWPKTLIELQTDDAAFIVREEDGAFEVALPDQEPGEQAKRSSMCVLMCAVLMTGDSEIGAKCREMIIKEMDRLEEGTTND